MATNRIIAPFFRSPCLKALYGNRTLDDEQLAYDAVLDFRVCPPILTLRNLGGDEKPP